MSMLVNLLAIPGAMLGGIYLGYFVTFVMGIS